MTQDYRGRFAPSPTGPLHFGSLVAALASWLDARANSGEWLVRIEDIDPPRAVENSDKQILSSLESHGLNWDGEVSYQSQRQNHYAEALDQLESIARTFRCRCSRADLAAMGGSYDSRCKEIEISDNESWSKRFAVDRPAEWNDLIQGPTLFDKESIQGDFIVLRRDGLYSYQLAVAVDDWQQQITHVIRGFDLFDSTARQIMLLQALDRDFPRYGHFPLATNDSGQKLSKQTHAAPLLDQNACANLLKALRFLGQETMEGLNSCTPSEILAFATSKWDLQKVPNKQSIRVC